MILSIWVIKRSYAKCSFVHYYANCVSLIQMQTSLTSSKLFLGLRLIYIKLQNLKCLKKTVSRFLGPFDDNNPLHFQVLLSIFKQLTGQKLDCPRYGPHWEQIGFQVWLCFGCIFLHVASKFSTSFSQLSKHYVSGR